MHLLLKCGQCSSLCNHKDFKSDIQMQTWPFLALLFIGLQRLITLIMSNDDHWLIITVTTFP